MANLNYGAVGYLGLLVMLGATISGISRVVSGGNFIEIISGSFGYPRAKYQKRNQRRKLVDLNVV